MTRAAQSILELIDRAGPSGAFVDRQKVKANVLTASGEIATITATGGRRLLMRLVRDGIVAQRVYPELLMIKYFRRIPT